MKKHAGISIVAVLAVSGLAVDRADASAATVTGLDDFSIHTVGEGLFGPTRRNALDSRFQVNGRNPNTAERNYGLWTAFNIDGGSLFANPISQLDSVEVNLFGANPITGQTVANVIRSGNFNVYFTENDDDVLLASNGYVWDINTPDGVGQFADRVLVASTFLQAGDQDLTLSLDLSTIGSTLIDRINNGDLIRFIFTSDTMEFASSWGVGVPGTSTILAFDGPAPTVTFAVPAPGAAAMLGLAGLMSARRRR